MCRRRRRRGDVVVVVVVCVCVNEKKGREIATQERNGADGAAIKSCYYYYF